jgi:hypothetical protein
MQGIGDRLVFFGSSAVIQIEFVRSVADRRIRCLNTLVHS